MSSKTPSTEHRAPTVTISEFINTIFPSDSLLDDDIVCITFKRSKYWINKNFAELENADHYARSAHSTYFCVAVVRKPTIGPDNPKGRIKRGRDDCQVVFLIWCDDIGTKAKAPPVAPSYRMETSPGNFQWGYLIEPFELDGAGGEHTRYFEACVRAMSAAGYSDGGADGCYRVLRLPGSVNTKPEHNGFRARLVEWAPERSWKLPALMKDLGLEPVYDKKSKAKSNVATLPGVILPQGDPVVDWLSEQGLLMRRGDTEGDWLEVKCPNADKHTDGNAEAAFSPLGCGGQFSGARQFKCQHAHCQNLDIRDFMAHLARLGAPADVIGIVPILNLEFAVVKLGSKTRVMHEFADEQGRAHAEFLTRGDFELLIANRFNDDGPLSGPWLASTWRREYPGGITFMPEKAAPAGFYNLWTGFAVTTMPGSVAENEARCDLFLDHLFENVCGRDQRHFDYLMDWFADMVQTPCVKPGVALVLRGLQGTGKSFVAETLGALLGRHSVTVSHMRHLTGNFNRHLADKLLITAEESYWGGNKKDEGALKDLITSPAALLEMKGVDAVPITSCCRLIMITNDEWAVPASADVRRFFVLDVGEERRNDHAYFKAMHDQLYGDDKAGLRALLAVLKGRDLRRRELRAVPETEALQVQKVLSLEPHARFLVDCLDSETVGCVAWKTGNVVTKKETYEAFIQFCAMEHVQYPMQKHVFVKKVKELVDLGETRPVIKGGRRERCWMFNDPAKAKAMLVDALGVSFAVIKGEE